MAVTTIIKYEYGLEASVVSIKLSISGPLSTKTDALFVAVAAVALPGWPRRYKKLSAVSIPRRWLRR